MARNRVTYEWAWEATDEAGDITDCEYYPSLALCQEEALRGADLALVKRYGNDDDGEVDRTYAYCEPGDDGGLVLPDVFEDGTKVPQRFHREVE